jgi:glycosyltransferase involved in cell wall biosynthesis
MWGSPETPMKVAVLTTDNRDHHRQHELVHPQFGAAPEALFQGFALLGNVEVHVVTCTQRPMRSPEKLAENIFFHSLHVPKLGWLRTGYQGCIRAVRNRLMSVRPDIVHGQGTERECGICAIFSGFANVITMHGNMAEQVRLFGNSLGLYGRFSALLENFALPRTAGVFCNSAYTERVIRPRAKQTWRVPNAIRIEFLRPIPHKTTAAEQPALLCVGAVIPRKQQLRILDAVEVLRSRGKRLKVLFIGQLASTEPYGALFSKRIAQLQQDHSVTYCGERETNDLVNEFDLADAIVHFPSEEAFGLVVAEGLARNLKLFGSRVGGLIDIAAGVDGAELIDPNSSEMLAAAIEDWIDAGCPKPTTAAAIMRQRYHPQGIANRHLEIYRDVLTNARYVAAS